MTYVSRKELLIQSTHLDNTITLWTLSIPEETPTEQLKNLKESLKIFPEDASSFCTLGHVLRQHLEKNIEDFYGIHPVSIFSYRGELIHGPFETYSQEGKLQEKGLYKYGTLHGEFESYDDYGTFTQKGSYTEGVQTGLWSFSKSPEYMWYDTDGNIITSANDFKDAVKTALGEAIQTQMNVPSPL